MTTLVLGSTSPFRKAILEKLNIPFECAKPDINEAANEGESPQSLVQRLALEKAKAVAIHFPVRSHTSASIVDGSTCKTLIIGSDQVAVCDGEILGKPHNFTNAVKQLSKFSGKAVVFYTGLSVLNNETEKDITIVEPFTVYFNDLSQADITNYLHAEKPYNCAGSFKSEGLGICLFKKLEGNDPNTLIGLPLIKLVALLKQHGFDVLAQQNN